MTRAELRPQADACAPFRPADTQQAFVLFSGGVDSSLVLAMLTQRARLHGFAPPVPITMRIPVAPEAEETVYQQAVIEHLGLSDWVRLELADELDATGPLAERMIRRHGLPPAPTLHGYLPALDHVVGAGGGVLFTGEGGDITLGPRRAASGWEMLNAVRRLPTRKRAAAVALGHHTNNLLGRQRSDTPAERWPWLTVEGRTAASAVLQDENLPAPFDRAESAMRLLRSAWPERTYRYLDTLGRAAGVTIVHPFFDERFIRWTCTTAPVRAFRGRAALIEQLWPGLLPEVVRTRTSKARFNNVYFGRKSLAFARSWRGGSLRSPYLDTKVLHTAWLERDRVGRSLPLLQAAWFTELIGAS